MQIRPAILATLIAPSIPAVVFGVVACFDAPDDLGLTFAVLGAGGLYVMAFGIALTILLPISLITAKARLGTLAYALISGSTAMALFVAFSIFTGSFGPIGDWYWIPFAGLGLGACFGWLLQR